MSTKTALFGVLLAALSGGVAAAAPAMVVTDLNVRSGPGTAYQVVDTLPSGSSVDAVNCGGGWCQVGSGGYVSASYLNFGGASYVAPAPVYVAPPPAVVVAPRVVAPRVYVAPHVYVAPRVYRPVRPVYRPPVVRPRPHTPSRPVTRPNNPRRWHG